jgi:hypothetical protein
MYVYKQIIMVIMPTPVRVISQIYEGFCCSPSGGDSDRAVTSQPVWEVEEGWGLREEGVLLFVQAAGGHRHFGFDGDCCGGVNNLDGCPTLAGSEESVRL